MEALYFDNDAENVYIAIVTSVPPYSYVGGGVQGWGVYESRRLIHWFLDPWQRPGH